MDKDLSYGIPRLNFHTGAIAHLSCIFPPFLVRKEVFPFFAIADL